MFPEADDSDDIVLLVKSVWSIVVSSRVVSHAIAGQRNLNLSICPKEFSPAFGSFRYSRCSLYGAHTLALAHGKSHGW